jgi:hypothetical protein
VQEWMNESPVTWMEQVSDDDYRSPVAPD